MKNGNRMMYLDLLRGFAILGILVSNLPTIAEPPYGIKLGYTDLSIFVSSFGYFLITGKFFLIFSFVFGYGFTILIKSAEAKGLNVQQIFFRRLLGLFCFGILHACFFFNGDILVSYSILGLFLYFLKDADFKKILKISFVFWIFSVVFYGIIGFLLYYSSNEDPAFAIKLTEQSLKGYLGNFASSTLQRMTELKLAFPFIILFNWPSAFSFFLIGLWMGRQNILQDPETFFKRFKGYWFYIFLIGTIGNALFVWGNIHIFSFGHSIFTWASLALGGVSYSLIYCYGLFKFSESQNLIFNHFKRAMVSVGSMSLTNYLLHSILLAFFFNGWGLGFYGKLPPEKYMLLVIPIYGFNLVFSLIWKRYFQMGPCENLLRRLTYA